jgi:hypothetical protein
MTSPATLGASVNIPFGKDYVQVPLGASGGTIVNSGNVPILLSPTNPPQGAPKVIQPSGACPWGGGSTLYASVGTATVNGACYVLNDVTSYAAGGNSLNMAGIAGVGVISTTGIHPGGGTLQAINLESAFQLWSWGWSLFQAQVNPTKGTINLGVNEGQANDCLTLYEAGSSRLAGITSASDDPIVIVSTFNTAVSYYINYSLLTTTGASGT